MAAKVVGKTSRIWPALASDIVRGTSSPAKLEILKPAPNGKGTRISGRERG